MSAPTVCFVSARLGEPDGVSVAAAAWMLAFERLGFEVRTVAGEGLADCLVPGLALDAVIPPPASDLDAALKGAGLVVVENLCSLPLNLAAARVLAACVHGRRAILHHHDFPWQRKGFEHLGPWPPDDPDWAHVTINEMSRRQLSERGIEGTTVYNGVLPAALRLAEALGAIYWLTGPVEDGYGPELDRVLAAASCETLRGIPENLDIADAYEASDAVVFPSTWEGFGLPIIESAQYRKPLAVGRFPIVDELAAFGFQWFPSEDPGPLRAWLEHPDPDMLDRNHDLALRHFSVDALADRLAAVLHQAGWVTW